MSQLESTLQATLVAMLRQLYPSIVINLSLNGISLTGLSPQQKAQLIREQKQQGMEPGIMDLVLYLPNGKLLNLELKVGRNDQSPDQQSIQAKLTDLGHNYYVIRDYQSVFNLIAEHTTTDFRLAQQALADLTKLPPGTTALYKL